MNLPRKIPLRLIVGVVLGVVAIAVDVCTVLTDPRTGDEEYGVGMEWYFIGFSIASAVWITAIPFFASGVGKLMPSHARMISTGIWLLGVGVFLFLLGNDLLSLAPFALVLTFGVLALGCLAIGATLVSVSLARAYGARSLTTPIPSPSTTLPPGGDGD